VTLGGTMFIYLDPASLDKERFHRKRAAVRW
jgi:hypothetical protein